MAGMVSCLRRVSARSGAPVREAAARKGGRGKCFDAARIKGTSR